MVLAIKSIILFSIGLILIAFGLLILVKLAIDAYFNSQNKEEK